MPLLSDALPLLTALLNLYGVLILRLCAARRSCASVVLLHPAEHMATPVLAKQLIRLVLANRAANVEDRSELWLRQRPVERPPTRQHGERQGESLDTGGLPTAARVLRERRRSRGRGQALGTDKEHRRVKHLHRSLFLADPTRCPPEETREYVTVIEGLLYEVPSSVTSK